MRLWMTLDEAVQKHTLTWMQIDAVIGAGKGEKNGKPCIHILVRKKTQSLINTLPTSIEGYRVILKEIGSAGK